MASRPEVIRRYALSGVGALLATVGAQGLAQQGDTPQQLIEQAQNDLGRGDGVAAEFRLKDAIANGAPLVAVAASMGEAQLLQGNTRAARDWLGKGQFVAQDAVRGLRALARLERTEGRQKEAALALGQALRLAPENAGLWVDVGRLRYAVGEQFQALEAADRAVQNGAKDVRALEFKGQLVRDSEGGSAALPWFEKALTIDPNDFSVLGEKAATLGDMGRARDMLAVCRQMLKIAPNHPRPYYLLAVLAARAGDTGLSRMILNKAGEKLQTIPGYLMLDAVLNLRDGNPQLAIAALQRLLSRQPANLRAHRLMAYALFLAHDDERLITLYSATASRPDGSRWLQRLVARAYQRTGQGQRAVALRAMAQVPQRPAFVAVPLGSVVGDKIAVGRLAEAQGMASASLAANPGFAPFHALVGDVALASGDRAGALNHYHMAGRVRVTPVMGAKMAMLVRQTGRP